MNFACDRDGSRHDYGVLCHRQYADRICDALLCTDAIDDGQWLKLSTTLSTDTPPTATASTNVQSKCTVIPTPEGNGPRKSRIGYVLLIVRDATISPGDLPPMARKQISWAGEVTHKHKLILDENTDIDTCGENNYENEINSNPIIGDTNIQQSTLKNLMLDIWKEISKSYQSTNTYRIDVHPKPLNAQVCEAFTTYINEISGFDHRIKLSFSASKVTHVVNIVVQASEPSSPTSTMQQTTVYWGISNNKQHFEKLNQRLNDNATHEIILKSTDPKTGLDKRTVSNDNDEDKGIEWDAPVSRAYYKLAQVFGDETLLQMIASHKGGKNIPVKSILSHGSGLDIGASPGGWCQVLHNTLGLSTIGVDPGILAQRVMQLQGVHHVQAEISSDESIQALAHHAPYSTIVCDASISHVNEMIGKIVETLESVSSSLNKSKDIERNVFALPLCLVITLKLPYKSVGSINRNLDKAIKCIPDHLRKIALLASSTVGGTDDVEVQYKICHLFANSVSERTLIAVLK